MNRHKYAGIVLSALLFLAVLLSGCATGAGAPPTSAALSTEPPPTQTAPPPSTHTLEPTAIATQQAPELLPTVTEKTAVTPEILPTRPIFHPPAAYTCPWIEQAQTTPAYTFRVVNTYPHDSAAYTQGLIYRDGALYEGTGLYGQSSLRKVALESGEVQQEIKLAPQYFGEGITELDGKIYQLTWRELTGFMYDEATFEELRTFTYATEGWGLTQDGKQLIMSDGSSNLYYLDPETLQTTGQIAVTAENTPVPRLNELEYIEGEVWANLYQTSCIARIDPASGKVLGWIDIGGILAPEDIPGSEVPNGIAYDAAGKRIFVTGKLWPRLFEIVVEPME